MLKLIKHQLKPIKNLAATYGKKVSHVKSIYHSTQEALQIEVRSSHDSSRVGQIGSSGAKILASFLHTTTRQES